MNPFKYLTSIVVLMLSFSCPWVSAAEALAIAEANREWGQVSVTISCPKPGILRATFTPPEGFYFYDPALPKGGLQGVGRPTLIEIGPNQSIQAAGPISALQPLNEPEAGMRAFPAGAVDLDLPFVLKAGVQHDSPLTVVVHATYMACSDTACHRPVTDRPISITLPVSLLAARSEPSS